MITFDQAVFPTDDAVQMARKGSQAGRDFFDATFARLETHDGNKLKNVRSVPEAWRLHIKECRDWLAAFHASQSAQGFTIQKPNKKQRVA